MKKYALIFLLNIVPTLYCSKRECEFERDEERLSKKTKIVDDKQYLLNIENLPIELNIEILELVLNSSLNECKNYLDFLKLLNLIPINKLSVNIIGNLYKSYKSKNILSFKCYLLEIIVKHIKNNNLLIPKEIEFQELRASQITKKITQTILPTPNQEGQNDIELDIQEIIEFYLEALNDINKKNSYGYTALMIASKCGHLQIAQYLLANNASIEETNSLDCNRNALLYAAEYGHADIIELLLDYNVDIDAEDTSDLAFNALSTAYSCGQNHLLKLLIKSGINTEKLVIDGMAQHFFMNQIILDNNFEMLKFLLNYGGEIEEDEEMFGAVNCACLIGNLDMITLLINRRADVNHINDSKESCLSYAIAFGEGNASYSDRPALIKLLIDAGANVNFTNVNAQTPLFLAVKYDQHNSTKLLLNAGAHITEDISNLVKKKVLDLINSQNLDAKAKLAELCKIFTNFNSLEITDNDGNNWLHLALKLGAETRDLQLATFILKKQPILNSKTNNAGVTPEELAAGLGIKKITSLPSNL